MAVKKVASMGKLLAVEIAKVKRAAYNPRKKLTEKDEEYKNIKASIEQFGMVQPIVWNKKTKTLIGGEQRLKILQDMGYTHVEAAVVSLTKAKESILNLALNNNEGAWDSDKLGAMLKNIKTLDLPATGFSPEQVAAITNYQLPTLPKDAPEGAGATSPKIFQIVVDCDGAGHQKEVSSMLDKKGYKYRLVTI